jgi:hypothetical protein
MSTDVSCGDDIPGRRRTELELHSCKSFDDQHRRTALWTKPSIARTGGGYLCLGLCSRVEQLKAKWQGGGTSAIGQEAEVSDAHEPFREQMQQEAAQEFID